MARRGAAEAKAAPPISACGLSGRTEKKRARAHPQKTHLHPLPRARATALERGINSVLNPVLAQLMPLIAAHPPGAARVAAAADALPRASAAAAVGHPAAATPAVVGGMLTVLNALAAAAATSAPVPLDLFSVSSVAALASLAAAAADADDAPSSRGPSVDEEAGSPTHSMPATPSSSTAIDTAPGAAWRAWTRLLSAFATTPSSLAVALDPPSKAALAALEAPALVTSGLSAPGRAHRRVVRLSAPAGGALAAVAAALDAGGLLTGGGCGPACLRVAFTANTDASTLPLRGRAATMALFESAGAELVGLTAGSALAPPPPAAVFAFRPSANAVWFEPGAPPSPAASAACRAAGWLAAQAVATRAPLGLPLPPTLFARVLAGPLFIPTLEALADFDPAAAAAVRAAACAEGGAYAAACAAAGLAPTTPRPLFAAAAAKAALIDAVAWQVDAFAEGWWAGADRRSLARWRWTPADLAAVVGGDPPAHARVLRVRAAAAERAAAPPPPPSAAATALPPLPPLRKAERVPVGVKLTARASGGVLMS